MKLKPIGDKILVERLEAEGKTKGGIVLPDTAKEKPKEGRVISVGDGRLLEDGARAKFQVQSGDRILFTSWGGTEVKIDGKEFLVLPEDDILAILKDEKGK